MPLAASAPAVAKDAWVAPSATLIGEVDVSKGASVWYGAVVRGEVTFLGKGGAGAEDGRKRRTKRSKWGEREGERKGETERNRETGGEKDCDVLL